MNTETIKIAQMLQGVSSDYLANDVDLGVFKMQVEFANSILNKVESRFLIQGEKIHEDDEFLNEKGEWEKTECAGDIYDEGDYCQHRRPKG